jgi:hypothetical protein
MSVWVLRHVHAGSTLGWEIGFEYLFEYYVLFNMQSKIAARFDDQDIGCVTLLVRASGLLLWEQLSRSISVSTNVVVKYTVVFHSNWQSRVTHPPIDIEIWQGSRVTRPFVEPPECHTGLKIACKTQKKAKFVFQCRKFRWCHANFGCCPNVELVFGVTRHTQCRFERNTTVY